MSLSARLATSAKWLLLVTILFLGPARTLAQTNVIFNYTNLLWKFRANSTNFTGDWTSPGFDDSSWSNGFGVFATHANEAMPFHATSAGARINTLLSTNNNGSYAISYYFRAKFDFPSNAVMTLTVSNLVDDGAVIYLNGSEFNRLRMPEGIVTSTTYATSSIEVANLQTTFALPFELRDGLNVLAIAVHQAPPVGSFNNPDSVFGLALSASPALPMAPAFSKSPQSVTNQLGSFLRLSAAAGGNPRPTFQWYWNNRQVSGATQENLTFPSVALPHAGDYFVVASNLLGLATSSIATVTVALPSYFQSNSVWKFHALGVDLGSNWVDLNYDDSTWADGAGVFGAGFAGLLTPLPLTNAQGAPIPTYYFRKTFSLDTFPEASSLLVRHLVDDGAVFYLNGKQIHRFNIFNRDGFGPADGFMTTPGWNSFVVPRHFVKPGTNVIAVRLHQYIAADSDIVFAAEGIAQADEPTTLSVTNDIRSQRIAASDTTTLTFGVSGGGAFYSWFKDGDLLHGETGPELLLANVSHAHAGNYHAVASNIFNSVTSAVASIQVFADSTGPQIDTAFPDTFRSSISVNLIEEATLSSLLDPNRYQLQSSNSIIQGAVTNVIKLSASNVVLQLKLPLDNGRFYSLSLSNLIDRVGNLSSSLLFPLPVTYPVFGFQTPWDFRVDTNPPPAGWKNLDFDDSSWFGAGKPAVAPFASGAASSFVEPRTSLSIDPGISTHYFRTRFVVPNNFAEESYSFSLLAEDAAAVYVNGVELLRVNLPNGVLTHSTRAMTNLIGNLIEIQFPIPSGLVVPGENILAVQTHLFAQKGGATANSAHGYNAFFALKLSRYTPQQK